MQELERAKNVVNHWVEANKERIQSCLSGEDYSKAATLDSYNAGMEQAMILVEQAFSQTGE